MTGERLRVAATGAPSAAPVSAYRWFKIAVFALLVLNTAAYLASGTLSEALDSMAWLVLLVLFALEGAYGERLREGRAITVIRVTRLAAAGALVAAMAGYLHDREGLDALNIGLWVFVVALLEFEVRRPAAVMRHRRWFAAAAATLCSGLGAVVLVWLWQGDWFDAYDAGLWLLAFAAIELDMLQFARRNDRASSAAPEPG